MKSYPSIPHHSDSLLGSYIYAFFKEDGSNIRVEWSKKRGFYKFGSRNVMLDEKNEHFGDVIDMFMNKYAKGLEKIFKEDKDLRNTQSFVCFLEYVGENSFAGMHFEQDEKDLVLIDISQHKKGMIAPKDFINKFQHLHIPDLIYQGFYTEQFIHDIKNNTLAGYNLDEGVVIKGVRQTKRKSNELTWMIKLKTKKWLEMLKDKKGYAALVEEFNGDKDLIEKMLK